MLGPRIAAERLRRFWTMLAHCQGGVLNAAQLARSLSVDGKTVAKYLDLLVDLLLVRRLPPYHANVGKRLVKSPKTYIRDSGLVHSLLRIDDFDQLLSHPIAGMSWEGYVIENLLRLAPQRTEAFYYRTATGVELDLLLRLPGGQLWAIEVKRSTAPTLERGFRQALEDTQSHKAFIVYGGAERYPKAEGVEAISLEELAGELTAFWRWIQNAYDEEAILRSRRRHPGEDRNVWHEYLDAIKPPQIKARVPETKPQELQGYPVPGAAGSRAEALQECGKKTQERLRNLRVRSIP